MRAGLGQLGHTGRLSLRYDCCSAFSVLKCVWWRPTLQQTRRMHLFVYLNEASAWSRTVSLGEEAPKPLEAVSSPRRVYQFPARREELEHKDAAWFSSQTSWYRRSLCLLDTFMIHRGLRGESRRRNILSVLCSAAAAGKKKKTNFADIFAFHFPQMGCQLSATSRKTIERGEGTETRASIPLAQPCVRECKLCPRISRNVLLGRDNGGKSVRPFKAVVNLGGGGT